MTEVKRPGWPDEVTGAEISCFKYLAEQLSLRDLKRCR